MSNKNKFQYRQVGDYLIPNLILPPETADIELGKWGMLHKDYLLKHKTVQFNIMITKGILWTYLLDVDRQAKEMYELLIEQMQKMEGVTEQLKENSQIEWIQLMDSIQERAQEIVCNELIYI